MDEHKRNYLGNGKMTLAPGQKLPPGVTNDDAAEAIHYVKHHAEQEIVSTSGPIIVGMLVEHATGARIPSVQMSIADFSMLCDFANAKGRCGKRIIGSGMPGDEQQEILFLFDSPPEKAGTEISGE